MKCDLCNGTENELKTNIACGHELCLECFESTSKDQCVICINHNSKTTSSLFDYMNTVPILNRDYLNESGSIDTHHKFDDKDYLSKNASKLNFLSKSFENKSIANVEHEIEPIDISTEASSLSTLNSSQSSVVDTHNLNKLKKVELKSEIEAIRLRHHHDENAKSQMSELSNVDSDCILIDNSSQCRMMITNDDQFKQKASFIKQSHLNLKKEKTKKIKKIDLFAIFLLFIINLLNFIDRFTLAGVLKDLQVYFSINDKECGLLQTVFICSYMLLAPLFGYLGDRYSRKWIIICGVLMWSLTTFLGAFVPRDQFWVFVFLRSLVGVGEASYSCIAPTIIGDLFTDGVRTKCLALFYLAVPLGGGLGYIIGSNLASIYNDWRYALFYTPQVGFLFIILFALFVKEPKRGAAEGSASHQVTKKSSFLSDTIYLMKNKTFIWITAGFTFASFVLGGLSWWIPLFVEYATYSKNEIPNQIPLIFGVVTGISGIVGVSASSILAPKLRAIRAYADPVICAVGSLIAVPTLFLMLSIITSTSSIVFWIISSIGITSMCLSWAMVADILLYVIHPDKRSIASALNILIVHLFGDSTSPYVIGAISDSLRANQPDTYFIRFTSLRTALYASPFFAALSFGAYLFAAIYVESDKKEVDMYIKKKSQSIGMCEMNESPSKTKFKKFQKTDSGIGSLAKLEDFTDQNNNISDVYTKNETYTNPLLDSPTKNLPTVNEINESSKV